MASRVLSLAGRLASYLPGLLALAGLAAVAYWGHAHDWKVPKFSQLWADEPGEENGKEEKTKEPEGPDFTRPVRFASKEAVEKTGLEFAEVEERPLPEYVTATGVVEYDHTRIAHLAARVPGTVYRVEKHHGQRVAKGDVLALIDAAELGKAKTEFLLAHLQVTMKAKALARLDSASVPPRQVEEAETALREARFRRQSAEQALANLGLPVRAEALNGMDDEEQHRFLRFVGLPAGLRQQLERETTSSSLLPLAAPFDGVVVSYHVAVGEYVGPSHTEPLFIVADVRTMWVSVDVREEDAGRVKRGQELTFRPDQLENESAPLPRRLFDWVTLRPRLPKEGVSGDIEWISTEVDEKTRTVKMHAHVLNPGGLLRANSFGTGQVLVRLKPEAVAVPHEAVQADGKAHYVFVRVDEVTFQPRRVRPGLRHGGFVEVKGDLRPGEVVVTTGSHVLKTEVLKSKIGGEE